jgi:hypothetical protein
MQRILLHLLLIAAAFTPVVAQIPGGPAPEPARPPESAALEVSPAPEANPAYEMLQQAYYLGGQLPTDERAYQVSRVVVGAAKMRHPMLRQWASEVLQLTAGLPQRGMRQPTEQLAVKSLAEVDPAAALQMLTELTPAAIGGLQLNGRGFDIRTNAARDIFPKYWKGVRSPDINAVRSVALHLADTGQYPTAALAAILKDVGAKDTPAAEMLFLDALGYHQRDQFTDAAVHTQFLQLLNAGKGVVRDSMVRNGVEVAVARLLKQAEEPPSKDMLYVGRVASGDGFVDLKSVAEEFLYKILPLVREFAPELESRILERSPHFKVIAPSDIGPLPEGYQETGMLSLRNADGTAGDFEKDPAQKTRLMAQITNTSRAVGARRYAESDPEAAKKLANSITDPALRAAILAELAGKMDDATAPAKGAAVELDPKDEKARLTVLVGMARAQAARDDAGLWDTLDKGLELAEDLFEKEIREGQRTVIYSINPDGEGPLYRASGFQEANTLLRLGMDKLPENTLAWLGQEHDAALKSYLLVTAAEALWTKQQGATADATGSAPGRNATINIR